MPDFIYIGVARAGSTWLFEALRSHPEIYVPPAKDIYFFDRYYDKGLDWYRRFFAPAPEGAVKGELSHDYYFSEAAAERIRAEIPKVKLICCLREPVECLISGYRYNKTMNLEKDVSLAAYAQRDNVRRQFDYFGNLRYYFERFPREQIKVVFFDDLQKDPISFARDIYSFLGVNRDFVAPTAELRVNPARDARNEWLAQRVYQVALWVRRAGMANIVGRVKQSPVLNRLLYTPRQASARESLEIPADAIDYFRKDYADLERMIGRPLPEAWYA